MLETKNVRNKCYHKSKLTQSSNTKHKMADMSITIQDYLMAAGVDIDGLDIDDMDLSLVTIGEEDGCWRLNGKFLFCELNSPMVSVRDKLREVITKLRKMYHPDKNGGDSAKFNAISELLKSGGPSDGTMNKIMCMLSRQYETLVSQDITDMSIAQLKQYTYTFMEKFFYVYTIYTNRVVGLPFIYLPGLEIRLKYITYKFLEIIRDTITSILVSGQNRTDVKDLINTIRLIKTDTEHLKQMNTAKLLRLCQAMTPTVISVNGVDGSIRFSSAIHGLHKVLNTTIFTFKQDKGQMLAFKDRVLDKVKFDSDALTTRKVEPRLPKFKRPRIKKRTWGDKRPFPINTDLPVKMPEVCERAKRAKTDYLSHPRKSDRLAKLHPRRSARLSSKC